MISNSEWFEEEPEEIVEVEKIIPFQPIDIDIDFGDLNLNNISLTGNISPEIKYKEDINVRVISKKRRYGI